MRGVVTQGGEPQMAQTTKTMNPVVAQIPLEEWEMLAIRNINRKLAMAGVTGIEHGAVPGNGGTGATGKIPAVVLGFVGTKPGATRPEIRLVVAKKFEIGRASCRERV